MPDPTDFTSLLGHVAGGGDLTRDEMRSAMGAVMRGEVEDAQIAVLLTALAARGETADEVAGAALAMREQMTPIRSRRGGLVDTCGTGGGGSRTFNISTTAAIVAAAAGARVAKHGGRSVTSRSGSADVLAALGVNLDASVSQVERCLDELGLCFCYAPLMHAAMRHVAPVRKRLGIRTIFNLLGPLANPAGAESQLLGAGRPELRPLLADAVGRLGTRRTLVVSGRDGLGDVTISGPTDVTEVTPGGSRELQWTPDDFGVPRGSLGTLVIDSPAASAAVVRQVLDGSRGGPRDVVVLNAAAALIAADLETQPGAAAERAAGAIDSGAARRLLQRLAALSHTEA